MIRIVDRIDNNKVYVLEKYGGFVFQMEYEVDDFTLDILKSKVMNDDFRISYKDIKEMNFIRGISLGFIDECLSDYEVTA